MMRYPSYKVAVKCFTFNQSKYITDTMNGFTMQQTKFPFVCIIVDDASTDGEQDVIKSYINENFDLADSNTSYQKSTDYAEIIYAQHKTNKQCYFAVLFLRENHYCNPTKRGQKNEYIKEWVEDAPYHALCEGDDYWINENKLQKQYEMLETHPEYSLCHHDYLIRKEEDIKRRDVNIAKVQKLCDIATNNCVSTLTMFYRNTSEPLIPKDFPFKYTVYQYFLNLRLAEYGNIVYINEPMAVYRINPGGIFSMQNHKRQITMMVGNLENMILWYKVRKKRNDVVKILKQKALGTLSTNYKHSLKHLNLLDTYYYLKWFIHIKMM